MSLHRLSDEEVAEFRAALRRQFEDRGMRQAEGRPSEDDGDDGAMRMFAWVVLIGVVVLSVVSGIAITVQLMTGGR